LVQYRCDIDYNPHSLMVAPMAKRLRTQNAAIDQPTLFECDPADSERERDTSSTFTDNLSLPIHRWFRYSAGFSAAWVREVIDREQARGRKRVFDPFVGSGTVVLEGEAC